jgi:oligoribonuclease NrnB/cAMP/cGMP phosphodiesterase (DHH superfamily)
MPPIVIHHNDDDGRCAGAVVVRELCNIWNRPTEETVFEYKHGYQLIIPTDVIEKTDEIYIVDVAIDNQILDLVKLVHDIRGDNMPKITLIDHHKTSKDIMDNGMQDERFELFMIYVRTFIRIGISGTLLTWMYAVMTEAERNNIPEFDFTVNRTHFALYPGKPEMREYRIPWAIPFIDDWDVWIHEIHETKYFNLGFSMESNKHPLSEIWDNVIYGDDRWLKQKFIDPGELLYQYQTKINERAMNRAFETEIDGVKCLCLKQPGNSMVFGDTIKEYPMVGLFYYDGKIKQWKYSLYSDEETGIDTAEISAKHGGGGHKNASGFNIPDYIL